ncbi:hypothetical protein [Parafrankia sp. FMc2]|uniref:hypothetical protein n=1 Tax=Parafrankia sp. FMc2 TaxID=3233196 RepID=UPI0034D59621
MSAAGTLPAGGPATGNPTAAVPAPPIATPASVPRRAGAPATTPGSRPGPAAVRALRALRAVTQSPPGRLRLLAAVLTAALVALLVVSLLTTLARQRALATLDGDSGPSFVAAQQLHAELSGADATIARAFLAGGVEPPAQVTAYQEGLAAASGRIIDLALAGGPREPLSVLTAQLPVYTGLVERARANNRVGNVVGGAYLRQAAELMKTTILPAVDRLAAADARDIDRGYAAATRWYQPVLIAAVGALAAGVLLHIQLRLFRRTHRMFNPPLVAATALTLAATGLVLAAFGTGRARLIDSRDEAYRPMAVVAQARVLALRAWDDESLSLIARGNSDALDADARRTVERLGYDPAGHPTGTGVLAAATAGEGPDEQARDALVPGWEAYQVTAVEVRKLVSRVGGFQNAVRLALGDGTTTFTRFDDDAATAFDAGQRRFTGGLSSAAGAYDHLPAVTGALLGLAVLAGLAGVQARINDYRR